MTKPSKTKAELRAESRQADAAVRVYFAEHPSKEAKSWESAKLRKILKAAARAAQAYLNVLSPAEQRRSGVLARD